MTITIYDVAKEAKVSMATVSRVVNNNPNVKEGTRLRVQEVIKKLRYTPNAVARGLASKKTTTIGIVLPDIADLSSAEVVSGIESVANMYKYNRILYFLVILFLIHLEYSYLYQELGALPQELLHQTW